ncbi:MAG: sugar phosphate isomerase/epimerase [Oscillospiraceae bacterium]|jgi:sugar phosphate isomerase/epimerase|nr:sugar phosphate isomerase/epimerase [Oscillospiraceae bacterium]
MKLGVLTVLLSQQSVEDSFKYLSSLGVETVEIGCGGYPGNAHLDTEAFLKDEGAAAAFKDLLKKYNLKLSALSAHANSVHPNKEIAEKAHSDFIGACRVAEKLGVDTVITFSGCPGDHPGAKYSNWVTCPWPDDFQEILDYQWNEVLIPYWKSAVKEAAKYGVTKIALEMHPGFNCYNPYTLLKLREAVGDAIGANFDPSHLFWQGIEPCEAIKELKDCIFHFHAKDTKLDRRNIAVNGVLDTRHYSDVLERSWVFRTVGYGNSEEEWREIISTLATIGYDGAISIEHEDSIMSVTEGLEKAIEFLKGIIVKEKPGEMWWA